MESDSTSNFAPIIKLLTSNNDKICLNNNTITLNQYLFGMFDTQLINIKVFFIILLIIASLVNKDYNFIKANPFIFSIETILYSLCATIPFIYMEYKRKTENNNILKIFLITFFAIAATHILLQVSGFYTLIFEVNNNSIEIPNNSIEFDNNSMEINNNSMEINNNSKETFILINNSNEINDNSKKEKLLNGIIKSLLGVNGIIFILLILILVYSSLKIHNFDIENYDTNFYLWFILETLIFSICNSLPFIFISKNREQITDKVKKQVVFRKNIKIILLIFITYSVIHILLQSSGFYNNTFGW